MYLDTVVNVYTPRLKKKLPVLFFD